MGKKERLLKRLLSRPKDFTFEEMESLLGYLVMKYPTREKPVAQE